MSNASDGARIKVWPGVESLFQDNLNGGGGLGRVRNVTYDQFYHENNDNAITITQCYGQKNQTLCNQFPVRISDQYHCTNANHPLKGQPDHRGYHHEELLGYSFQEVRSSSWISGLQCT